MEKPTKNEIKKKKPGPKPTLIGEEHDKHREAVRRYYFRKKEEEKCQ